MVKHFTSRFIRGFFALLPILVSVYILVNLLLWSERSTRSSLTFFLAKEAEDVPPGSGIVVALLVIYGIGYLLDKPIARKMFRLVDDSFQILPLVRSLYQAIKDFTSYLTPNKNRTSSRVVMVHFPNLNLDMVGIVTRENLKGLPEPLYAEDKVAVYMPMSYQFGGYTVFVSKEQIKELPIGTEQTMRSVLTAWVAGDKNVSNS